MSKCILANGQMCFNPNTKGLYIGDNGTNVLINPVLQNDETMFHVTWFKNQQGTQNENTVTDLDFDAGEGNVPISLNGDKGIIINEPGYYLLATDAIVGQVSFGPDDTNVYDVDNYMYSKIGAYQVAEDGSKIKLLTDCSVFPVLYFGAPPYHSIHNDIYIKVPIVPFYFSYDTTPDIPAPITAQAYMVTKIVKIQEL